MRNPTVLGERCIIASKPLRIMTGSSTGDFYDTLAPYFDLIFEDWNASMQRQGDAIASLLHRLLSDTGGSTESARPLRIFDAAAGIGTQSIPLAQRGFDVTSRDLSQAAIVRLRKEAAARSLSIEAAVGDMRDPLTRMFDAVIACDNSVPHLLTDLDLERAFRNFVDVLRPGGVCILSVRDYAKIERGKNIVQPYGEQLRDGIRHVLIQVWRWLDEFHYELTFYIIIDDGLAARVVSARSLYYAVATNALIALLEKSGFTDCARLDDVLYQPIIVARKPVC